MKLRYEKHNTVPYLSYEHVLKLTIETHQYADQMDQGYT